MIEIQIADDLNKLNFKILGMFELEMRPGKQLFPLNYGNIINDKGIKYNIKAIKIIVRETYGGVRTYINQIMFYEQSAEEVKDLLCSNVLNKIYKLSNKKHLRNNDTNNYNSEPIIKKNKTQINQNGNSKKKKNRINNKTKNKNFEEKQEESDIYKTSNTLNGKDEINNNIEITPITKKPNKKIKTEVKNNSKIKNKEKLEIKFNDNDKNDNLTPNKYLQRIKSLNKGNKTSNVNNRIKFPLNLDKNMFNTSINNNSEKNKILDDDINIMIDNKDEKENDFQEEDIIEDQQQNLNSFNSENVFRNNSHFINGQNNNNFNNQNPNLEFLEENISNISSRNQKMSKTYENLNYIKRNNNNYNNPKSTNLNNDSIRLTNEDQNPTDLNNNNNNNYSQRHSLIINTIRRNQTNQIKQKLDYLEGNILEIKKSLQEISEGFAFCISQNYINNFKEEILFICDEIYNEYYPNNNIKFNTSSEKNGNESLISNSNYISKNDINDNNNKLEKELENQINQKLDEKLGSLQNNIFDKYLKPTINKIGDSMKKNLEQIQVEVDNMDKMNINENSKNNEKENDLSYKLSTSKIRNEKFDEINKIGERLYNKLLEKEKKLKLLKQEKAKFLDEDEED